ncbi:MAG: hypothetical protein IEMM0002_1156 [bacterium]|nr:MAG: hypothetical protein IEMM0002_1156 [bacterium]
MTRKETLMILGGGVDNEPAMTSLKEHGYRLVLVDGNADAHCFAIADSCGKFDFRDVEKAIELARKENVKAVLPTHDRAVAPAAKISEALSLKGASVKSAETATSKKLMRKIWLAAGLPSPKFEISSTLEDFMKAVKKTGLPAICKPVDDVGGGSRGVMKIDENTNLEQAYRFAASFSESSEIIVESFYKGLEHSVEVLMKNGTSTVLMVSDKIKTAPPYRVDKSVMYPTALNGGALEAVKKIAAEAAGAVGLVDGAAHVELCTLPGGEVVLFEIGLRCGGGATPHPIAEQVTGINQIVEYAEILLGRGGSGIRPIKKGRGMSYHFITSRPGLLKRVEGFCTASRLPGIISSCLTAGEGDTVKELKTSSQRLGFFVACGSNAEEAYERGIEAEKHLHFIYEG